MWDDAECELDRLRREEGVPEHLAVNYRIQIALGQERFGAALRMAQANAPRMDRYAVRAKIGMGDPSGALQLGHASRERNSPAVRIGMGLAYEALGRTEEALAEYEATLWADHNWQQAAGIARCLVALGAPREAAEWFVKAQTRAWFLRPDLLAPLARCADDPAKVAELLRKAQDGW